MTQVSMKRTFIIEMDDNTTMEAVIAIAISTDDEFYAEKQINSISANDLLPAVEDIITRIMCDGQGEEEDEDEDHDEDDDIPECAQ